VNKKQNLKAKNRRLPYCGTRYSEQVIQDACNLKKQGVSFQQIRETLKINATNRTQVRWYKSRGVYDTEEEENV